MNDRIINFCLETLISNLKQISYGYLMIIQRLGRRTLTRSEGKKKGKYKEEK